MRESEYFWCKWRTLSRDEVQPFPLAGATREAARLQARRLVETRPGYGVIQIWHMSRTDGVNVLLEEHALAWHDIIVKPGEEYTKFRHSTIDGDLPPLVMPRRRNRVRAMR